MTADLALNAQDPAAQYVQAVVDVLSRVGFSALAPVADALAHVRRRGGHVFVVGNGGSAAAAEHLALSLTHDPAGAAPSRCPQMP
jgi:phosphoheptose isomerase